MGVFKDLTGSKINRWYVTSKAEPYKSPSGRIYVMWNCICECGSKKVLRTSSLTSIVNKSKSCGCLSSEKTKKRFTTHGMSKSPTYNSYTSMVKRCNNTNDPHYKNYGGRGINVCERWLESFENFFNDMGIRPKGKSIDRINNEEGYYPENCKWSTKSEQQLNQRKRGKTSKYRGVCFSNRYKTFVAQVHLKINGHSKNKKIGNYKTEYEAGIAYDNYVLKNNLPNLVNGLISSDHKPENRVKKNGKKI